MTLYVKIDGGLVVNRAVFDGGMPEDWAEEGDVWIADDTAQIGWSYDGEEFTPPPPAPVPPVTTTQVNAERDRRIADGLSFGGKPFNFDPASKARVAGAATLAGFAMAAGAQAGDLRWHGGDSDFTWIAGDNSLVTMDAQTCFAFGQAAAAWETANIFAARALKDQSPIPADFADDSYWPG